MYPNDPLNRLNRSPDDGAAGAPPAAPSGTAPPAAPAAGVVQPAAGAPPAGVQSPAPQMAVPRQAAPAAQPDPYAIAAGVKPTGLDDKFWDPQAKAIRLPELMKSYGEIQTLVTRRATEMSDPDFQRLVEARLGTMTQEIQAKALKDLRGEVPAEPKDYAIAFENETLAKMPEAARELSQYESDPLVGWFRGFAHEVGLGPQQFNKAFNGYMTVLAEAQAHVVESEQSRLGPKAQERLEAVKNFLEAPTTGLDKRIALALENSLSNADAFAAVELLIARSGGPSHIKAFGEGGDIGHAGPALATEEQIRMAQKDPRYWDPTRRDPGFVRAIEAAWQRLYTPAGRA
jgi:hypothetical protein